MMQIFKSRWRNRWHVYEVDTGGNSWLATFYSEEAAANWINWCWENDQ